MKELFKKTQNLFIFPRRIEIAIIFCFLLVYAGMNSFVINGDGAYGYAIVEKILDKNAFAPNDIVVNGSLSGNFLFYKLLAYLPFFSRNFPLYDFLLSIPPTILLIFGWYNIFHVLTKNRIITTVSLIFLMLVDARLSMGGTSLPLFFLTSLTSVYYLQVFSFYFFIIEKHWLSIILASLTTYLHPAAGFFFLSVFFLTLLLQFHKKENRNYFRLIKFAIISLLIILPNIALLNKNLNASISNADFFDIFYRIKGGHAYIEDYFIKGYIYTLATSVLIFIYSRKNKFIEYQDKILTIIYSVFIAVFIWVLNLYFIGNLKVFYLYLAMRSTYIIKPLFICFIILFTYNLATKNSFIFKLISVFLLVSLISPNYIISTILVLLTCLSVVLQDKITNIEQRVLSANHGFIIKLKYFIDNKKVLYLGVVLIIFASTFLFVVRYNNKLFKIYRFINGENLFNFSFDPDKNFGWNKKNPFFGELVDWAKQYKGKMFIVPLFDADISTGFRFLTKNSTYISLYDMGQLSYAPEYYLEGYNRLKDVGFKFKGERGYNFSSYNDIDMEKAKTIDADFIIFDKTTDGFISRSEKPVFENKKYIVYSLR